MPVVSSDIVERLRRITARPLGLVFDPPPHPLCKEAADAIEARDAEIERLRAEASFWEREHQREQDAWRAERALADQLAEALAWWGKGSDAGDTALAAWQEARQ